jgi:hypothetical protein
MNKKFVCISLSKNSGNSTIAKNLQAAFDKRNAGDISVDDSEEMFSPIITKTTSKNAKTLSKLKVSNCTFDGVVIFVVHSHILILREDFQILKDFINNSNIKCCVLFNRVEQDKFVNADIYNLMRDQGFLLLNTFINESEMYSESYKRGATIYDAGESRPGAQMNTLVEELLARYVLR